MKELVARINAVLRHAERSVTEPDVLTIGEVRLDKNHTTSWRMENLSA